MTKTPSNVASSIAIGQPKERLRTAINHSRKLAERTGRVAHHLGGKISSD